MPKNFTVDVTLFKAKAQKLIKQLKLDEPTVVKEQAALYSRLMSKMTPPFVGGQIPEMKGKGYQGGSNDENLLQGRAAIIQDMSAQFLVREKGYLEFLHKITGKLKDIRQQHLISKKGIKYTVDVAEINYNSPNRAKEFSDKMSTKRKRARRFPVSEKMWITQEIWQSVFVEKFLNIGFSKAAFASAAVQLGIKQKPPVWIRKHIAKVGTTRTVRKNPSRVTIKASAPGLGHVLRLEGKVVRFRMEAMVKRLEQIIRTRAKWAGFKTR
tara:strand:- start:27 stop:830 length:804 start_codon:yes stop_codon:yes gene_type:complete